MSKSNIRNNSIYSISHHSVTLYKAIIEIIRVYDAYWEEYYLVHEK